MPEPDHDMPGPTPSSGLDQCVQCGACMQVCPVYLAGRREEYSARGKLRLLRGLRDGLLAPDRELGKALGRCLLCGRCSHNCPSGVPAREEVQAGRARLAALAGAAMAKRLLLEGALSHPRRMDGLARSGALVQGVARALIPASSGLNLRLPGSDELRGLPPLAREPFLAQAPRRIAGPKGSPRLGLFVGCVTNYLRPGLAQMATRLLSRIGTVIIPSQGCCGLPALSAGLGEVAARLAGDFSRAFALARVDKVVTVCGSCAWTLAREVPALAGAGRDKTSFPEVLEISQVLAEHPRLLKGLGGERRPVALHDPCHLKVGLGVHEEPRAVLRAADVDMAPLSRADACCGGGGLFSLDEPGLSQAVFQERAADFASSGAAVLATSCSGCYLQWKLGLGESARVAHPLELLGEPA